MLNAGHVALKCLRYFCNDPLYVALNQRVLIFYVGAGEITRLFSVTHKASIETMVSEERARGSICIVRPWSLCRARPCRTVPWSDFVIILG